MACVASGRFAAQCCQCHACPSCSAAAADKLSSGPGVGALSSCLVPLGSRLGGRAHPALQIETSNRYFLGAMAVLAACTLAFGPLKMFNLYFMPYWINVIWLDVVTYLHHHGSEDPEEQLPWYRGKVGMGCLLEHSFQ